MKFSKMSAAGFKLALVSFALAAGAAQAETKTQVDHAASGAVVKATGMVTPAKGVPKVSTATGTMVGKGDETQYPSGTIPMPPKPKKEGLGAAAAVKAKAAQP